MKEFKVLPTDPRFYELTSDQMAFIQMQWHLDMEHAKKAREKAHKQMVGYDPEFEEDNPDKDQYEDPDFEEAWNSSDDDISEEEWEEV